MVGVFRRWPRSSQCASVGFGSGSDCRSRGVASTAYAVAHRASACRDATSPRGQRRRPRAGVELFFLLHVLLPALLATASSLSVRLVALLQGWPGPCFATTVWPFWSVFMLSAGGAGPPGPPPREVQGAPGMEEQEGCAWGRVGKAPSNSGKLSHGGRLAS